MTILQHILTLFTRPAPDLHDAALTVAGVVFDDAPTAASEAAYWRDVCEARGFGLPFPRDPVARRILTSAARATQTAGFCAMRWDFMDGSALTASDDGVWVR